VRSREYCTFDATGGQRQDTLDKLDLDTHR